MKQLLKCVVLACSAHMMLGCQMSQSLPQDNHASTLPNAHNSVQSYLGRTPVLSLNTGLQVLDYTFGDGEPKALFTLTPLKVIGDTRCPINARCQSAGRFVVVARVSRAGKSDMLNINADPSHLTHWEGYTFTVDTMMPLATTQHAVTPENYRMQFGIEAH